MIFPRRMTKAAHMMAILALLAVLIPAAHLCQGQAPVTPASSTGIQGVAPVDANLVVGGGDLLFVSVFDVPELSGKFRVEEDGAVSLPLLSTVHVGGLSTMSIERELRTQLINRQLIRDPQVSVQILEFGTQGITVGGEVSKPGIFPSLGGKRLYDVLALSGGLTPQAGNVATVFRRGATEGTNFELRNASGAHAAGNVSLYPGDTVMIQRAGIVYVLGDVQKPGGYAIDRRSITVLEALSVAEGPTKTASLGGARILRRVGDDYRDIPVDIRPILKAQNGDVQLKDGDVLYVPISGVKTFYLNTTQGIVASLAAAAIYALNR